MKKPHLVLLFAISCFCCLETSFAQSKKLKTPKHLYKFEFYGKFGFIDISGKDLIKPKYDGAGDFSEGLAHVWLRSGECHLIDLTGKKRFTGSELTPEVAWFGECHEGMIAIKSDGHFGFIKRKGDVVVNPTFTKVRPFNDGFAAVQSNGKWGFIDKAGKLVVSTVYSEVKDFSGGLAAAHQKESAGGWGYINSGGEAVTEFKYEKAGSFAYGLAVVKEKGDNGLWSYIDSKGKQKISANYSEASDFRTGCAYVRTEEAPHWFQLINPNGKILFNEADSEKRGGDAKLSKRSRPGSSDLTPGKSNRVKLIIVGTDGVVLMQRQQGWYIYSSKGRRVKHLRGYHTVAVSSEGLIPVAALDPKSKSPVWGFVSSKGAKVAGHSFLGQGGVFKRGLAFFKDSFEANGKRYARSYYVNRRGKVVWSSNIQAKRHARSSR